MEWSREHLPVAMHLYCQISFAGYAWNEKFIYKIWAT